MNRRNFLKLVSAVPFVGLIPVKKASADKIVIHTPHSLSLEYPGNRGIVVCKDFEGVKFAIDKFACHPEAEHVDYTRYVKYSNGSLVLFQTVSEVILHNYVFQGWVAIDRDIKSPNVSKKLRGLLKKEGVPYHWFRFTNETLLSGCECKGTGRLWSNTIQDDPRSLTARCEVLSVRSCDCDAGVQREKRLNP